MRIIAGKANRRKLETLPGEDITRPTTERVKEALFSAIQFELANKRVLDLFAGTGQLALEALSRGSESAVLIDENAQAVDIIKLNAKNTGLIKQCRIACMDYSSYLKSAATKNEKFDIIFLDPPYSKDMKDEILKKVSRANILNDGALLICETDKDVIDENGAYSFKFRKKYKYGRVIITLLEYFESSKEENSDE